jgi:hypothetical protein
MNLPYLRLWIEGFAGAEMESLENPKAADKNATKAGTAFRLVGLEFPLASGARLARGTAESLP